MDTFPIHGRVLLAAALVLLAGCGERQEEPPPVPLAEPAAPDTRSMGAGGTLAQCGIRSLPEEVLQQVNAARARGHRCGGRNMAPASALKWDPALHSAAASHSLDMARRNYFDHRSPEGVDVSQRVSASRYKWKSVGENLAGGDRDVAEVVQGWLNSPDHCENLMDPKYADVAVACVSQPGTEWGTYWTMVLARK